MPDRRYSSLLDGLDRGELRERILKLLPPVRSNDPGYAIGIAIAGEPIFREGIGVASIEQPVALSPSKRMRIGSVTKQFTCLGLMLLCEEGRAAPDDLVKDYLPELGRAADGVTIRHLMQHQGGLRDPCNMRFQFAGVDGPAATPDRILAYYQELGTSIAHPGTRWAYSNGGYVLLTILIERLAGRSYAEFLKGAVLDPINLYDTAYRPWDHLLLENSASPHISDHAGGFTRLGWGLEFAGGGALVSTVDDMLRWLSHVDRPIIGSPETWKEILRSGRLQNGTVTGYGLGVIQDHLSDVELIHHPGGWLGGTAQIVKVPSHALDIVVLVNRDDMPATVIAETIVRELVPEAKAVPRSEAPGNASKGYFHSPSTNTIIAIDPSAGTASVDGYPYPVTLANDGSYRSDSPVGRGQQVFAMRWDDQEGRSLEFSDFGTFDFLEELPAPVAQPALPTGSYESTSREVRLEIRADAEGCILKSTGPFGSLSFNAVEAVGEGAWLAKPAGILANWFQLILIRTEQGILLRSAALGFQSLELRRADKWLRPST